MSAVDSLVPYWSLDKERMKTDLYQRHFLCRDKSRDFRALHLYITTSGLIAIRALMVISHVLL
jgi:hypothetical protein